MKEIKKVPILTEMKGKTGYIAYKMDKQCAYNIYSTSKSTFTIFNLLKIKDIKQH